MYPAVLFTALSYSGTLIENVNIRQKAIPTFCEVCYYINVYQTVSVICIFSLILFKLSIVLQCLRVELNSVFVLGMPKRV